MKRALQFLLFFIPILVFSQQNAVSIVAIKGKVIDKDSKLPLEDATVLFKTIDSNNVKFGSITDKKGNFSVEVEAGEYTISIEYLAYKTKILNVTHLKNDMNLGIIELEFDTQMLSEVEITSEKRTLEIKPDKMIFNVAKDLSANSGMAIDVLNNIPAVTVDADGNIQLRGQQNITVLINGKISSLTKADALKSLPAGSIDKVEVITNPGAQHQASALGIINIILKKGLDSGLNGSVTLTGGYRNYLGGLVTLNSKTEKVNFYTQNSYFKRNRIIESSFKNTYYNNGNTISFLDEIIENDADSYVFDGKIGADFYLTSKSTLGASFSYTNIDSDNNSLAQSKISDTNFSTIAENERVNNGKFRDAIYEFSLDFEQNFTKEGEQFKAYITYSSDTEKYDNAFTNSNPSFTNENFRIKNTLENLTVDAKYANPISAEALITVGYFGQFGKTPFEYFSATLNNLIDFTDNTNAFFADFENQSEKFYFGLGLRAELTDYIIDYSTTNKKVSKSFDNFFPSIYLEYSLSDMQSLGGGYSRRIEHPNYAMLMPYEEKISENVSYIGNENLNPVLIDMSNLTYTAYGNSSTFSATAYYNVFKSYLQPVTYENGELVNGIYKTITTPFNIGNLKQYGVNLSSVVQASKSLSFTANVNIYNLDQEGLFTLELPNNTIVERNFESSNTQGSLSLLTQIKFGTLFNLQTNVKHNLKSEGAYSVRKAFTYADVALSRDFWDKKGTLNFTIDDLFLSNKTNRDRYDFVSYFSEGKQINKYRKVLLSFTYRFNQSKKDRNINFEKKEIKPNF